MPRAVRPRASGIPGRERAERAVRVGRAGSGPAGRVRNYNGILRYRPRLESVDAVRQIFFAWSNLVQFDNVSETIGYNSRVRWKFRPGARPFLVLNQLIDRNHSRLRWERTEATVKLGVSFRF